MAKRHISEGPVAFTEANLLYFYKVLAEKIGMGRQTFLPKAVEALAGEELTAEALGYEDAAALFSALDGICDMTAFKGGRFYVTLRRREDWDALLAGSAKGEGGSGKGGKAGGKPWRRKKGSIKPVRPKTREVAQPEEKVPAVKAAGSAVPVPAAAPGPAVESEAPTATPEAPEPASQEPADEVAQGPTTVQEPADAPAHESATAQEPEQAVATTHETAPTPKPAVPSILEQIAEQERLASAEPTPTPTTPEPAPAPVPAPEAASVAEPPKPVATVPTSPASAAPAHARNDLPSSISDEVSIKSALIGLLTRILPIEADLMAVLDEDWRVARATGTVTGSRNLATFPLRYLQEDGSAPVSVTIRRMSRPGESRRWRLTLVDGDDGTGNAHEAAGIEGLPQAEGGFWIDLSTCPCTGEPAPDPVRDLAQFMEIGTWETALGTLATMSAPERWNYPGEGVGKESRYGILRDYLAATLARVRAEGKLTVSPDGSLAAFDTGLSTPADEPLVATLSPTGSDIPWHLDGFATPGVGELGVRLASSLATMPAQAEYLRSLDDVRPRAEALAVINYRAVLGEGLRRLPRAFVSTLVAGTDAEQSLDALASTDPAARRSALRELSRAVTSEPGRYRRACRALDDAVELSMRRARRSYRHVAPAYDAARRRMVLLLPLALVDEASVDCALALELMPSGAYQASCVTSLPRAYAAARVVSNEAPAWLAPEHVLG